MTVVTWLSIQAKYGELVKAIGGMRGRKRISVMPKICQKRSKIRKKIGMWILVILNVDSP